MTTTTPYNGRLGNQIIRNLAVSFIAEKNDLYVSYASHPLIYQLGIPLYVGKTTYGDTISLTEDNYFAIYQSPSITSNLDPNHHYFQTREIMHLIYNHLRSVPIKQSVIDKNPFKYRYNTNNDLCIHIRLTDVEHHNPGLNYYLKTIQSISFDHLYITTDDKHHPIVKEINQLYPNTMFLDDDLVNIIQFATTCKHVLLSHGSFSATIGYLAFFSDIHYPEYDTNKIWYGDMFSIPEWIRHSTH
jgi:hypothetical protein